MSYSKELMMRKIAFICIIVIPWITLYGQTSGGIHSIEDFLIATDPGTKYKLYLHTDREYYLPGDTIWFSPYVVMAEDNMLLPENVNLNIELIDIGGRIADKRSFILEGGICSGWIAAELNPGTYVLRAYTDPMRSWDETTFFRKTIHIGNLSRSEEEKQAQDMSGNTTTLNLYPEGGFLVDGRSGRVAFVARDRQGRRTDLQAYIVGPDEDRIPIKTTWKGTGSFLFTPVKGYQYQIVTEQNEKIQFEMPEIRSSGTRLLHLQTTPLAVSLVADVSPDAEKEDMYIALFYRGKARSYVKVPESNAERAIAISTDYFGPGINHLVLLNNRYEPLSGRLVFINKDVEDLEVNIDLEDKEFTTRERIDLHLTIPSLVHANLSPVQEQQLLDLRAQAEAVLPSSDYSPEKEELARLSVVEKEEEWARVSVTVVNDNMTGISGNNLDIRSWLLLDSELKGQVQSPGSYFVDDSVLSAQKLDLLMLTNGWRDYLWNSPAQAGENLPVDKAPLPEVSLGYTFSGRVTRSFLDRPFPNAEVFLNIADYELRTTKTGKDGLFRFDSVVFFGPSVLLLKSLDHKGYSDNTRLQLYPFERAPHPVEKELFLRIEDIGLQSWRSYRRENQTGQLPFELYLEEDARLLQEINIVSEKPAEPDPHVHKRFYGTPSHSKKITLSETHYPNVFRYLEGRFPGVHVYDNNNVIIRGGSSIKASDYAILMLDGMIVDKEILETIPMHDIDIVEIITGAESAIFGVRGVNGVVSVLTRIEGYDVTPKEIPGLIVQKVEGFENTRIFYSPDYPDRDYYQSDHPDTKPDHRKTLYWNPVVLIDNDPVPLSFYSCDQLARYLIFVEGISSSGKICLGKASFMITKHFTPDR